MHSRIFLIGFMGSGKSTIGSKLARKLGYNFVDMDHLIEETAGMTIPKIFSEFGEKVFRKWEYDIVHELCLRERIVVSTGGGAPCHDQIIQTLNEHGITIYLKLPPAALKDRLMQSKTERPLIQGKSESELMAFIIHLMNEREPYYTQARCMVDGVNLEVETLYEELKHACQ
jgi:shikimate kinase